MIESCFSKISTPNNSKQGTKWNKWTVNSRWKNRIQSYDCNMHYFDSIKNDRSPNKDVLVIKNQFLSLEPCFTIGGWVKDFRPNIKSGISRKRPCVLFLFHKSLLPLCFLTIFCTSTTISGKVLRPSYFICHIILDAFNSICLIDSSLSALLSSIPCLHKYLLINTQNK